MCLHCSLKVFTKIKATFVVQMITNRKGNRKVRGMYFMQSVEKWKGCPLGDVRIE